MQLIAREKAAERARGKHAVILIRLNQVVCKRQFFCVLEHRIAAAARFYTARNGQVAVALQKQFSRELCILVFRKPRAHFFDLRQRGFDQAAVIRSLGKGLFDKRRKALQARRSIVYIGERERTGGERRGRCGRIWIDPRTFVPELQLPNKLFAVEHHSFSCLSVMYCCVPR